MSEKKLLRKLFTNYSNEDESDGTQTEYEDTLRMEKKRKDYLKKVESVVKSIDGKENERN